MWRLIHADVQKCFDRARHDLLIDLLREQMDDEDFLTLIRMFLTNPILGPERADHTNSEIGIAQGSVLFPILMNVILHRLDLFATGLCNEVGVKYARYCDDATIATMGNSNIAAWDVIGKLQRFLRDELSSSGQK